MRGNRQLGIHLCLPRAVWSQPLSLRGLMLSRPVEAAPNKVAQFDTTLVGYPDWRFPCFSSVVRQMSGYSLKRAHPASPSHGDLQRPLSPRFRGLQLVRFYSFWLQPLHIHPTKVLFAKDKLPHGGLHPPVAIALSPNTSRPSAKTTKPVSVSTSWVTVYKALFSNPTHAFRMQEWFIRASRKTLPLVYFFGWF
jgi:hypothetical protein